MLSDLPPIIAIPLLVALVLIFIDDFVRTKPQPARGRTAYWICIVLAPALFYANLKGDPGARGGFSYFMFFLGFPLLAGWTLSRAKQAASDLIFRR